MQSFATVTDVRGPTTWCNIGICFRLNHIAKSENGWAFTFWMPENNDTSQGRTLPDQKAAPISSPSASKSLDVCRQLANDEHSSQAKRFSDNSRLKAEKIARSLVYYDKPI